MFDGSADTFADEIGHHLAVAMFGVAFEAEDADPAPGAHQLRQFIELFPRSGRREMRVVDPAQLVIMAAACGLPTLGGSAKAAQMQVADATFGDAGGEMAFGEAGAPRGGNRAHVDQKLDPGAGQRVQHGGGGDLFIADGEERNRYHGASMTGGTALVERAESVDFSVPTRTRLARVIPGSAGAAECRTGHAKPGIETRR